MKDRPSRFFRPWTAGKISILLGFILTILSTLGAALVIEPAAQRREKLDAEISASQNTVRLLRMAQAQVEAFFQLGTLIFSIDANDKAPVEASDALAELKQRSLNQRHEGVRNFITQLAIAGEIDFTVTSERYEALVESERQNFTLENYRATNTFEHELALKAVIDRGDVLQKITVMEQDRAAVQTQYQRLTLCFLFMTAAGSILILVATLLAAGQGIAPELPGATAPRLMRRAIAEAKRRIARSQAAPHQNAGESNP